LTKGTTGHAADLRRIVVGGGGSSAPTAMIRPWRVPKITAAAARPAWRGSLVA